MKRILIITSLATAICYGQEFPNDVKSDTIKTEAYIHKSGIRYSGKTYIEIYDVVTDSVVHRFGLEFCSADSSFIRKIPMEGTTRKFYDQMQSDSNFIINNQERLRKETIEIINRFNTSYEVWFYFKVLGIFGK